MRVVVLSSRLTIDQRVMLFKSIAPLWEAGFVHGFISKEDTQAALEAAKAGTFICRFSNSAPGKLAVSYKGESKPPFFFFFSLHPTHFTGPANDKVSHLMVTVNPDGFLIGKTSYVSFSDILSTSKVFTTVAPDLPLESFREALEKAAGSRAASAGDAYSSVLE